MTFEGIVYIIGFIVFCICIVYAFMTGDTEPIKKLINPLY